MEDKEIIRLFKGMATEISVLSYKIEADRERITKLERRQGYHRKGD